MRKQLDLFAAESARNQGIEKAKQSANERTQYWSKRALFFLKQYMRAHPVFTIEQVRIASENHLPEPPHARAWGAVAVMAKKQGLIKRISYAPSQNPKAHCATVSVWQKIA